PGFSGADLANLVNEAALLAARKNKKKIEMDDFEEAKDKVTLGKARKSKVITDEDKKITSVHEVGHVLCSIFLEKVEPIHKVTIIPRGFSGGATHFLQTDKIYYTKTYMEQSLVGLMGGRAAEEIIFNELSTGASNDIQRATDLAKQMVCNLGMSDKIGPVTVAKKETQIFLGRDISRQENISEETAKLIDNEVRRIISNAHKTASEILESKRTLLEKMSDELLEKETLIAEEIYSLVLDNVPASEKDFVKGKYKRVQEMKLDTAPRKTVRKRKSTPKTTQKKTEEVDKKQEKDKT
ncbi:MAG: cell division protein FtsH, partial [Candidatus Cloacimonetes bacterium]|nr:cell division protein FtsH [Candidatus Cloacimonadota bacterium]